MELACLLTNKKTLDWRQGFFVDSTSSLETSVSQTKSTTSKTELPGILFNVGTLYLTDLLSQEVSTSMLNSAKDSHATNTL